MIKLTSKGLHRAWKNYFINEISPNYRMKLIDVAGGTGNVLNREYVMLKYSSVSLNIK